MKKKPQRNLAELLFQALQQPDLDARETEALPWLAFAYVDLNWSWLVREAKLNDLQNRLGFVTAVSAELAEAKADPDQAGKLRELKTLLDRSRLAKEDTLCRDSVTLAERKWLRQNRSPEAEHWNLLTDMRAENLFHLTA